VYSRPRGTMPPKSSCQRGIDRHLQEAMINDCGVEANHERNRVAAGATQYYHMGQGGVGWSKEGGTE